MRDFVGERGKHAFISYGKASDLIKVKTADASDFDPGDVMFG